jgi:hypothetical protein
LCTDDQHRRLGGDIVGSAAAELLHERLRVLAAERRKFSSEDDDLVGEGQSAHGV